MQKKILPKSGESCSDLVIVRHVAHLYSILKNNNKKTQSVIVKRKQVLNDQTGVLTMGCRTSTLMMSS